MSFKRSVIELSNTHTARLWQHGTKASRGFRVTMERSGGDSLLVTMSCDSRVMMMLSDRTPAWDADTGVMMLWITALCVCLHGPSYSFIQLASLWICFDLFLASVAYFGLAFVTREKQRIQNSLEAWAVMRLAYSCTSLDSLADVEVSIMQVSCYWLCTMATNPGQVRVL